MTLSYKYTQEHTKRLLSVMPDYLVAWKIYTEKYVGNKIDNKIVYTSPYQLDVMDKHGWQQRRVNQGNGVRGLSNDGMCCYLLWANICTARNEYAYYPQGFHCYIKSRPGAECFMPEYRRLLPVISRLNDILAMGTEFRMGVFVTRSIFFHPELDVSLYNPANNTKFEQYLAETWPDDFPELTIKENHEHHSGNQRGDSGPGHSSTPDHPAVPVTGSPHETLAGPGAVREAEEHTHNGEGDKLRDKFMKKGD